jgi:hypothetical protein
MVPACCKSAVSVHKFAGELLAQVQCASSCQKKTRYAWMPPSTVAQENRRTSNFPSKTNVSEQEATVSLSVKDRTGHALYTTSSSTMTLRNSRRSPNVGNVSNHKWFSTLDDPDPSSLALFGDKVA